MLRLNETGSSQKRPLPLLWPCFFFGALLASTASTGQSMTVEANVLAQHGTVAPTTYRVINLRPASESLTGGPPAFNAHDQLTFSTFVEWNMRGWFYDGASLVDIGYLNPPYTFVSGINDAGQVSGESFITDLGGEGGIGEIFHAFVWSKSTGMRDLGTLGGTRSSGAHAINNLGQVVGRASAPDGLVHPFRWSASAGMLDLGLLSSRPGGMAAATAINDAGKVAGWGDTADGNTHAFRWTPRTGMTDLGTLGGSTSVAIAIGTEGQVAGNSTLRGQSANHAFIWTRERGMQDLGTAGGAASQARRMSPSGHMIGTIFQQDGGRNAFSWTRATGMLVIGTFGGQMSTAYGVNNKGQVVGGALTRNDEEVRAFLWTAKRGLIDLNKRLRRAPAGLVLSYAHAISDNGYILAGSNAGLVLLAPGDCATGMHAVGPITAPAMVQLGRPFASSVSFSNDDPSARHNVMWNWGDGSGDQQGNARESNGAGVASADHAYTTQGTYTVTAKVGERSGKGPTVSRTVVAYDPSPGSIAGSGWFSSPQGAHKAADSLMDKATITLLLPSTASAKAGKVKPRLVFDAAGLGLRSDDVRLASMQGTNARFEGSGMVNGHAGYLFALNTTIGTGRAGEPARIGLKIWHVDPATKAAVVDYDNSDIGPDSSGLTFHGEFLVH